jgi:hypothetical protein
MLVVAGALAWRRRSRRGLPRHLRSRRVPRVGRLPGVLEAVPRRGPHGRLSRSS